MPAYIINGCTIIVKRTLSEKKAEKIKNGLFNHFMNIAIDKLEESKKDGSEEPTKQI